MTSTEAIPPQPPTPSNHNDDETKEKKTKYSHMILLDELEEHARAVAAASFPSAANVSAASSSSQPPPPSWTLANDAMLARFLNEFSSHVQRRAVEASRAIQTLEDKARAVGTDVSSTTDDFLLRSDAQFVENRVEEEEGGGGGEVDGAMASSTTNTTKAVRRGSNYEEEDMMKEEEVEESAVMDGMKALAIFYDPAKGRGQGEAAGGSGDAGNVFGVEAEEDDACYYDSSPGDVFNQRLLPFVVGTRDFMESTDAGLGPDDIESVDGHGEEDELDVAGEVGNANVVLLEEEHPQVL